jgi:hypothetical protein
MGDQVCWVRLGPVEGKAAEVPPWLEIVGVSDAAIYFDASHFFWDDQARASHEQQEPVFCLKTPDKQFSPSGWLIRHSQFGAESKRALMHWTAEVRAMLANRRNELGH